MVGSNENAEPGVGTGEDPSCINTKAGLGGAPISEFPGTIWALCDSFDLSRQPFNFEGLNDASNPGPFPQCGGQGIIAFPGGQGQKNLPCMIHQSYGSWTDNTCLFVPKEDDPTDRLKKWADAWRACVSSGDEANYVCEFNWKDPTDGSVITAAMSIGHGVAECGDFALIKYDYKTKCTNSGGSDNCPAVDWTKVSSTDTRYLMNLQHGMRSWSLELQAAANRYLAPSNTVANLACEVPQVVAYDFTEDLLTEVLAAVAATGKPLLVGYGATPGTTTGMTTGTSSAVHFYFESFSLTLLLVAAGLWALS